MKHFWLILITEIKRIKASKAFHLVALASPLMFLYAFTGNLAQDISFPVAIKNESVSAQYADYLPDYKSPSGIPYFSISEKTGKDVPAIIIKEDLQVSDKATGDFRLYIPSINTNVTKNYQNRLIGSFVSFLSKEQPERFISITEKTVYKTEPSWMQFFSVTILILGLWFCGMLFGSLAFSTEYQHNLILFYKLAPCPVILPMAGKLMAGFLKAFLVLCYYLFTSYLMGIILHPRIALSLGIFVLITISALSLGMIIGILCGEVIIAFIVSLVGCILLWVTGGGFGTSLAIHPMLRTVFECNPVTWCVRLAQHVFFSGPFYTKDIILLSGFTVLTLVGLYITYKKNIHAPGGGVTK